MHRVVGKDQKTGETGNVVVEARDPAGAFAKAAALGLDGEEVQREPKKATRPASYPGLRFCGYTLVLLAWIQVIVGLVLMFNRAAPAGLVTLVGFIVPMAFGCACLALRDIAIHTVPADA